MRRDLAGLLTSDVRLHAFALRAALALVPLTLVIAFGLLGTGPVPARNWLGELLGYDFSQVWLAGRAALEGRAATPYDLQAHLAAQAAVFGADADRFAWHYPPVFLLPAALLGLMPYGAAFPLWMLLTLGLFVLALRQATDSRDAVLIACAHPLVLCNLAYGQNGLLTAGLLTLGALLIDRRPVLAGVLLACVAYKPQLAALAPALLLVTGRWRALAAFAAGLTGLCALSVLAFGLAPWQAFLGTLAETNRLALREAWSGLDINASAFGAVRLLGGPLAAAWAAQVAVALLAIGTAWRVWASGAPLTLRAAALLAAAPLVSPYVPLYDLAPLVPASALLAIEAHRRGGLNGAERALLIASPLASAALRTVAGATGLSLGLALALATLGLVAARALPRTERDPIPSPGPSPIPSPVPSGTGIL
ncbi:glycosyltransferase family 87 protein [Methylobacterium durans]|uniref:glycosyltransferase family 87 protein n=1 Tax=Methylobacterium durans TaxID=2202825 RepID=UPI002AFE851E|nr:glycosyltransferase family 87 protein [Methylobacterium durans]MEA1834463.1 glycosyltransferase family 87 protein [Methylobacterium durans]